MSRFIIKVGTNLLTKPDGSLARDFIEPLVNQLARLHEAGHELILVTSGAMASGRSELRLKKERKTIPVRQVLAAVGQAILMNTYRDYFRAKNITIAQVLLTDFDFKNKGNFLNTKNILQLLLQEKVIPIINENDVTAYAELKFGDNDILSAKVAAMTRADQLIILTDVAGLYDKNPIQNPDAKLISTVSKITDQIRNMASGTSSKNSLGGMKSKITAAAYGTESGVPVIITDGRVEDVLTKIILQKKSLGTYFALNQSQKDTHKQWMKPKIMPDCRVIVDDGAAKALKKTGASLLPSGIVSLEGEFSRGDIVNIINKSKQPIAFGQVNYNSAEIQKIKGLKSDKISHQLGYSFEPEVMHRDNLVVMA